jgi:hypothetical protein
MQAVARTSQEESVMSLYLGFNRRSGVDRRGYDNAPALDYRSIERRRHGSDRYVLVLGNGGIDLFGLMVGFPMALLVVVAVLGAFAKT